MNTAYHELYQCECSDECAYHLIRFLHQFALEFENIHLFQAQRYARSLIKNDPPYEEYLFDIEENDEPPF